MNATINQTTTLLNKLSGVVTNERVVNTASAWKSSAFGFFIENPIYAAIIFLIVIFGIVIVVKTWLDASEGAMQMMVSTGAYMVLVAVFFFVFYILVDAGTITLKSFIS